jgi:hypothetical protein
MSSGMLRRVALVRTDVSEELSASFTRVIRIGELGTTLAVTNNRRTLRSTGTSTVSSVLHNDQQVYTMFPKSYFSLVSLITAIPSGDILYFFAEASHGQGPEKPGPRSI